ncbi:hypothetical protein [Nonomuraea sp. KM90]|uniref:hypothetical protein n=1 Tax=Nonomuraea sp. KM90 TaxID=3457428 RepID=UPI003FCEC001
MGISPKRTRFDLAVDRDAQAAVTLLMTCIRHQVATRICTTTNITDECPQIVWADMPVSVAAWLRSDGTWDLVVAGPDKWPTDLGGVVEIKALGEVPPCSQTDESLGT